jgi:hypothetical protein
MSFEWIREYYGVPAKRGARVKYTGVAGKPQLGSITSASGGHINVRIDGDALPRPFHPTWEIEYLDGPAMIATEDDNG